VGADQRTRRSPRRRAARRMCAGGVRNWGMKQLVQPCLCARACHAPPAAPAWRRASRRRRPRSVPGLPQKLRDASGCAAPQHLHTHVCSRAAAGRRRRRRRRRRAFLPPVSLERLRVRRAVAEVSAARGAGRVGGAGRAGGAPAWRRCAARLGSRRHRRTTPSRPAPGWCGAEQQSRGQAGRASTATGVAATDSGTDAIHRPRAATPPRWRACCGRASHHALA
jgi:hypothetical protein